jgi:hypothetical protein
MQNQCGVLGAHAGHISSLSGYGRCGQQMSRPAALASVFFAASDKKEDAAEW